MSRYYRFRLPPWAREWLIICEKCVLPIMIFQAIRTLFLPTTFDVLLLGVLIGIFIAFRLRWI
ncbi:hypothetical protein SH601_11340 [Gracilibacillus sp. S3-1-1]|uniref:Uncharacterized protein n=1 Tax=Gracilibacillus pellucidus TaxID=3095368 RepID=A0ACC6M6W1_9BACI|nr:hypothetical protein [Gracilibacillus sp. S3-1-1]MDX8046577.1 hypothetical protein [Gracilibacillus sp. S3-1-1]